MEHAAVPGFSSLLLVLGLAFAAPLIAHTFRKLAVPVVVLEILAGVLFGKSGFNFIHPEAHLEFLASFGFAYLMFMSGLEIDLQCLIPSARSRSDFFSTPLGLGLVRVIIVFTASLGLTFYLHQTGYLEDYMLVTFLLTNTSLGIVMPILREYGCSSNENGKYILVATLVADLLSILGLSTYVSILRGGAVMPVLFVLLLILSGALVYRFIEFSRGRAAWLDVAFESLSHGTAQLPLRAIFALILLFLVEAEALGAEVILGAFVAGATLSLLLGAGGESVKEKLDVIGFGLLIPIFFIMVGVSLNLSVLLDTPTALPLTGILFAGVIVINLLGAAPYVPRFGLRRSASFGMLLTSRLSLTIAGASLGVEAGLISHSTEVALIVLSAMCCTLGPVLFHKLRVEPSPEALAEQKPWLVIGSARESLSIATELFHTGLPVRLFTNNPELLRQPHPTGLDIETCEVLEPECLLMHGLNQAEGIILVVGNRRKLVELARVLRHHYQITNLYALARDDMTALLLKEMGVKAITPNEASHIVFRQMAQTPALFSTLTEDQPQKVFELVLQPGPFAGKTLSELAPLLPRGVRVLLVTRRGDPIMPQGNTMLLENDVVTLIGKEEALAEVAPLCEGGVCRISIAGMSDI